MNESLLKSLIRLFITIYETDENGFSDAARVVISNFLSKEFNREQIQVYIKGIEVQLSKKKSKADENENEKLIEKGEIQEICKEINSEFEQHQKVWLILQLVEFIGDLGAVSSKKFDLIKNIGGEFNISNEEFINGKDFILATEPAEIPSNINIILVDGQDSIKNQTINHIYHAKFRGKLYVLRIPSTNTLLVKYFGDDNLFLNSRALKPGRAYIFGVGSVIRNPRTEPIYYSRITSTFFQSFSKTSVRLTAENISYRHKGSKDGVYPFTFDSRSGQLIAIIGGSGVGKSTLINVLNGNLKPIEGQILINGYNIQNNINKLKGIIGYVPQDDLLIEDLTVFQNLFFSARFCFGNKTDAEITKLVEETIKDFDLYEARNLKVGNPINKFISGGQRKRLNIAMELLREPSILFADEPTSGLSSFDSERIMLLLKKQTFKGKIVIVNIHQPSSEIYKLFDKVVVMDQGGRVIFQGNPMDAVVYFKHEGHYLKAEESECLCCGNVNTELMLRVIEARVVNEYGKLTRKRKRSANEWYEMYLGNIQNKIKPTTHKLHIPLPQNSFKIPSKWKQTLLHLQRNFLSKFSNSQFMFISLLEAPALAFILAFFTKFISGTLNNPNEYIFANNDNIPGYLFMSIVACVFMGLTISAEEIIKDQRVRQRERFLNLSYFSYINSKILVLIIISAIQTLLFVLVGNHVLQIEGTFLSNWLVLFSITVCSNLIGLNISAALNSVVAIYISIPLIMVPMLLLSGVIINYNKLHRSILNQEYVPLAADVMPTRWAYEAICVDMFKENKFNRHFFAFDQKISNNTYYTTLLIPKLEVKADDLHKALITGKITNTTRRDIKLINNELKIILRDLDLKNITIPDTTHLAIETITLNEVVRVKEFLINLKNHLKVENKETVTERDQIYYKLTTQIGRNDGVYLLRRKYHNNAIEELVLNKSGFEKIVVEKDRIIRRYNPGHAVPTALNGRSHLFAPVKRIGGLTIDTLMFNSLVIWLMSLILYVLLLTNFFRIVNKYVERFRFQRLARRIARYIPI